MVHHWLLFGSLRFPKQNFEFRIPWNFSSKFFCLFLSHFFESVYLVIQLSDADCKQRTMVLQTALVMNMFSSLEPMHLVDKTHARMPSNVLRTNPTQVRTRWNVTECACTHLTDFSVAQVLVLFFLFFFQNPSFP